MIEFVLTQTTPTIGSTIALAVGAAIIGGQFQYPGPTAEVYQTQQASGSYSSFEKRLQTELPESKAFVQEMAAIYSSLAGRQEPFGIEFEAAIFDDIEDLYEV